MDRDHKIEKINAYRRLLETRKLPKISVLENAEANHLVAKELHDEFESWVEGQISVLLGESLSSSAARTLPFNDQEIQILKTLIAGVQARASAPQAQAKPAQEEPRRTIIKKDEPTISDAEKARLNATARPLGNRKMDTGRSGGNDPLVSILDKMEDEGPNF